MSSKSSSNSSSDESNPLILGTGGGVSEVAGASKASGVAGISGGTGETSGSLTDSGSSSTTSGSGPLGVSTTASIFGRLGVGAATKASSSFSAALFSATSLFIISAKVGPPSDMMMTSSSPTVSY